MNVADLPAVDALLRTALAEDIGAGDITTRLTVDAATRAQAQIAAKDAAVIAGLHLVGKLCDIIGGRVDLHLHVSDGDRVRSGDVLATLAGPAHTLLAVERVALNFLQHLSGIATTTARFVSLVSGTGCRIVDTRKTLPGLRILQKYAVRVGGGSNHRFGLADGILIKENHIAAAGGLAGAVQAARAGAPHGTRVEVECRGLDDVTAALQAGAELVLLDNMTVPQLAEAVQYINHRALVEASGGVSEENVRAVAATGVDLVSVGALTHSVRAADIHMLLSLE